jgi:peptide chain release factor 1
MNQNFYLDQIKDIEKQIADTAAMLNDPEMATLAKLELEQLAQEKKALEDASIQMEQANVQDSAVVSEPTNCIVEFRPGAGGEEAKIWASELARMYMRFAELAKLKIEMIDESIIKFSGKTSQVTQPDPEKSGFTAYELFKYESGVHRVQRVPVTEAQGRIHTSTASVAVLPEVHPQAVEIREEDLEWQFMRSSGAGGQNVNKVSSAARLTHRPSGIVVSARQEKKQEQNRKIALDLLRSQLWEIAEEERLAQIGEARSVIGRARRAEKIRTYNFPQSRVTDHRTKQSWHNLDIILEGGIKDLLEQLHQAFYEEETATKPASE